MNKHLAFLFTIAFSFLAFSCVPEYGGASDRLPIVNLPPNYKTAPGFPETNALERELGQISVAFSNTSSRLEKAKKTVNNCRTKAEDALLRMVSNFLGVSDMDSALARQRAAKS